MPDTRAPTRRETEQVVYRQVPRSNAVESIHEPLNCIDVHNHIRQAGLALERSFRTKNWARRLFMTIIGCTLTNATLAHAAFCSPTNEVLDSHVVLEQVAAALIGRTRIPSSPQRRLGSHRATDMVRRCSSGLSTTATVLPSPIQADAARASQAQSRGEEGGPQPRVDEGGQPRTEALPPRAHRHPSTPTAPHPLAPAHPAPRDPSNGASMSSTRLPSSVPLMEAETNVPRPVAPVVDTAPVVEGKSFGARRWRHGEARYVKESAVARCRQDGLMCRLVPASKYAREWNKKSSLGKNGLTCSVCGRKTWFFCIMHGNMALSEAAQRELVAAGVQVPQVDPDRVASGVCVTGLRACTARHVLDFTGQ